MATHRGAAFLAPQLESIAAQRQPPDEVVVVDDASGDGTAELVAGATAAWSVPVRIEALREHVGSTQAFGRGIGLAEGDVIVLSDQDDVWLPHKLERLAAEMADPSVRLAFSDAWLLDATGRRRNERLWEVAGFTPEQQAAMRLEAFGQILARSIVSGCTLAMRRELVPVVLPFPTGLDDPLGPMTHDRWISLVAAAVGGVAVVDEPLVGYRLHDDQQIGIPALQVRLVVPSSVLRFRQLAVPRPVSRARLEYYLAHLAELRRRLVATGLGGSPALARVDGAVDHLRVRRDLPVRRRRRVRPVARELVAGAYARYSLGAASATADLLRR